MKYLVLSLFFLTSSCFEEEADRIKRLEGLVESNTELVESSFKKYELLRKDKSHIDFNIKNDEVISQYKEMGTTYQDVIEEETNFFTNKSGEILGRNYTKYRKKYAVNADGKKEEVMNQRELETRYSETKYQGNLGSNNEGAKVMTLAELYDSCKKIIRDYTVSDSYKVTVNFKRANGGAKLLTDCYYTRENTNGLNFKSGISGLEILVD